MILKVILEGQTVPVEVPDYLIQEGEEFFRKMDADMDKGYQMSRTWVERPDVVQRCQIAADRLLTALEQDNTRVGTMMAAYILARLPGVGGVRLTTGGDMLEHEFFMAGGPEPGF